MIQRGGLSEKILDIYREFEAFQEDCTFLCEAITSMTSEEEFTNLETAMDIMRFSHLVKNRAKTLRQELKEVYQKSYTLEHAVTPKIRK